MTASVAALLRWGSALVAAVAPCGALDNFRGSTGQHQQQSLLQTWGKALNGESGGDSNSATPVSRVVALLKEMQKTLTKEMDDDTELYDKLSCWCNTNEREKDGSISSSTMKITDLQSSVEALTARRAELEAQVKDLNAEVASDKAALEQATEIRDKQAKEFQGSSKDSMQAIESLKAAIIVLAKHHGAALPQISFIALHGKNEPWAESHDVYKMTQSLDEFMQRNNLDKSAEELSHEAGTADGTAANKFLQQNNARSETSVADAWSLEDTNIFRRAMRKAKVFMQEHQGEEYFPSYNAQSGEIVGLLKQIKEEMEGDLSEAQKLETSRRTAFEELRSAKVAEIRSGEERSETKEDQLAETKNELAGAKEDLLQETAALDESQMFLRNLKGTCEEASKNFEERKQARTDEIKAVSETIAILMQDSARDTFARTYALVQFSSTRHDRERRSKAAATLRRAAAASSDPQLSMLASAVELDAFTKVKKAIDDMVSMLKTQQIDEVKKNDWCNQEMHGNELLTATTENQKTDLETKESALESNIQTIVQDITAAKAQIAELQANLQKSSEDRLLENREFQKTVADQAMTVSLLKDALDRLAKYYNEADLVQRAKSQQALRQTPPVPQTEYKPSSGSAGVMQMIQKLIGEAQALIADSRKAEAEAQVAYEQHVIDTNASVKGLSKQVVSKTAAKADADKEKIGAGQDLIAIVQDLEGLSKTAISLHAECDYLQKNFQLRQDGRGQEIEALQQAKQILSGASWA
eukprot:TRINITY_DN2375_c0_g1_i2.p1 TRINITY_DN2375_c0_g1~~TRINITY_DN2375_c0_g1_i2.p1  ORF type:complete len:758 (+),score=211.95 TRINITY_DN2375_c0_g1_i2:81-2354(+)